MLQQFIFLIFALFLLWGLVRYLKANPESLSKENLSKSFTTIGLMTLALIGFIALLIAMLQ